MTRTVFGDTGYWVATTRNSDELNRRAAQVAQQIGEVKIVTSEMVLIEYLNLMSKYGPAQRRAAIETVTNLRNQPNVEIVPVTSQQFWDAAQYYGARLDQRWSLVDCSSFQIMQCKGIHEALANDRDFRQAGFTALLRDD